MSVPQFEKHFRVVLFLMSWRSRGWTDYLDGIIPLFFALDLSISLDGIIPLFFALDLSISLDGIKPYSFLFFLLDVHFSLILLFVFS